jgi:hypothetical protein
MVFGSTSLDDLISSPDTGNVATAASELSSPVTPLTHSGRTSPTSMDAKVVETTTQKKKKKKKSKKSGKAKEVTSQAIAQEPEAERPPVLCISRNKHWRYISSYHVRTFYES